MDKELKELIVVKGKVIEQERAYSPEIGKDIGFEAGAKMIKRHFDENPDDVVAHFMGRNIIEKIFAQPGCVGLRMFHGLNEMGIRTIILVGVDCRGNNITNIEKINNEGKLKKEQGIVADVSKRCPPYCGDSPTTDSDSGWF